MQKLKKPISILLVFMMIVSLFAAVPMTVNAAPPGGSGPGGIETEIEIKPGAVGDYLTFTAVEAGSSVTLNVSTGSNLQYKNNNSDWASYTAGTRIDLASAGDSVRFCGKDTTFDSSNHVSIGGKVACSGSVMSLRLDDNDRVQGLSDRCFYYMFKDCTGLTAAPELPETTLAPHCYDRMFYDCTSLTAAPALPATTLAEYCYNCMFSGCISLTTAPALPATMLASNCYNSMFLGCESLTTAPELPATSLAQYCYSNMFYDCESLTTAPELPATSLAPNCYSYMFKGCTSLTTAPELQATSLARDCYSYMFKGCTSLTTAPELPATTLAYNCYSYMFNGCSSLTTAPELPATALANNCYYNMFNGCSSLTTAPELPATALADNCYYNMFNGCESLTTAPELPATTLANNCYDNMFNGCRSLTTAPGLPATTLAPSCYRSMFKGCESLTTAPELWATTLAPSCYNYMFNGCTSLTTAPELPATTLATGCYNAMFAGCTSLTTAPELPATTLMSNCYNGMFNGCTGIKLSTEQTAEYSIPYRVPPVGTGETATNALNNMFSGTGGTFAGTPEINKTYYVPAPASTGETIELNLNQDNATVYWDDSTGEYGYWAIDAIYDGKRLVLYGENNEQAAGTYEWANMKEAGTDGITDAETYETIVRFINGSCTVTVDEDVVTVSGTFTGVDRNTYVVTVTHEAPYYTITDESVNGAVTAGVNGADVTRAKAGKTVLLNVAPADGYRFKSITASAPKDEVEYFSDLVALMGDSVFDGNEDYNCAGYTCKVENGKFVVYNGTTFVTELSESNMTEFDPDTDYVQANSDTADWIFFIEDGKLTGISVLNGLNDYIYKSAYDSESTGSLPLAERTLTTVAEGSQYSFTMPAKNVTVKAEFEEAPAPELPDVIKDCTYHAPDGQKIFANVPVFDDPAEANKLLSGSIFANVGTSDSEGEMLSIVVQDAKNYSYKLYDKNGNEINATITDSDSITGAELKDDSNVEKDWYVDFADDDVIYGKEFDLGGSYDTVYIVVNAPAPAVDLFPQHSITLGGDIGVNFYIDSAAADFANAETAVVKFTWDNGNYHEEVDLKALTPDTSTGYYKATVDVVAAHMAHEIHAEVYLDGEKLDQTDDYSVKEYAETVYANPAEYDSEKPEQLKALAKALLNYGAMAQTVFASYLEEHPELANKTVGSNGYADVTAEQIGAAINGTASDLNAIATQLGAKFYTSSLFYLQNNTLRVYFTPVEYGQAMPNAGAYAGNQSGYYYYKDHANIPAAELDDQQSFSIAGVDFTYSALDYVKGVLNSNMIEKQKNLAKSLFLYNQAANAYFDEPVIADDENIVDLSTLTGAYEAQDGDILTGELGDDYKITIAAGATITLRDATINSVGSGATYAGINPLGDATILLEGANTVKGGNNDGSHYYPCIHAPKNHTLTIDGTGSLTLYIDIEEARSGGIGGGFNVASGNIVINNGIINAAGGLGCAGIGGGDGQNCGYITINGGTITASGYVAPGIGGGYNASCGDIIITGGTVNATGGFNSPGIGSGIYGSCGDITIAGTVTQVTATKGGDESDSIGAGKEGSCGTVTIAPGANVTQN